MKVKDQERFGPVAAALRDGTVATIRPLSLDDAEALGDFYEQVPREDPRFYRPHPLDRRHARQNAEKALDPFEVVLVLETAPGRIDGYAWYRWWKADADTSVFGICVRRDGQGGGTGKALMARLFEIAGEIGPPVMSLTVQKANERAVALYRKYGFRPVREQITVEDKESGFAPEPEYYMERAVR